MVIPVENNNYKLDISGMWLGAYIAFVVVLYCFIFFKHHKRNHIQLFELIPLFTNFFVTISISILVIGFAIWYFIDGFNYMDTRSDVIQHNVFSFVAIVATIVNFIFYLKRRLKDLDNEVRAATNRQNLRWGEILQFIIFVIMMFLPLWRLNDFLQLYEDKPLMYKEIAKTCAVSIASGFLLWQMNPLSFKQVLFHIKPEESVSLEDIKKEEESEKELEEKQEEEKIEEAPKSEKKTTTKRKTSTTKKTTKTGSKKTASNSKTKKTSSKKSTKKGINKNSGKKNN